MMARPLLWLPLPPARATFFVALMPGNKDSAGHLGTGPPSTRARHCLTEREVGDHSNLGQKHLNQVRSERVAVQPDELSGPEGWTIEEAERLLESLAGVRSARIVARPGGRIDEVHVLTTRAVSPKQTVRNVESALLARFHLELDHRKISVAQSSDEDLGEPDADVETSFLVDRELPAGEGRVLFVDHALVTENSRIEASVTLEWKGERFQAAATGADLPRARMEALATATLRAVEAVYQAAAEEDLRVPLGLELDGVKMVDAFERKFALIAVHALSGRHVAHLAGTGVIRENLDHAVIMGTLQATDRWVRGKI